MTSLIASSLLIILSIMLLIPAMQVWQTKFAFVLPIASLETTSGLLYQLLYFALAGVLGVIRQIFVLVLYVDVNRRNRGEVVTQFQPWSAPHGALGPHFQGQQPQPGTYQDPHQQPRT